MRRAALIILVALAGASPTFAQPQPPAASGNSAIKTPDSPQPSSPVAGANSFTEAQAKSRFEKKGFSNVSDLKKDSDGIWRGHAQKDGKSVNVSLDFQGNVFAD